MKSSYKIGDSDLSVKDLAWVLGHLAEHGPSGYKGSAFVLGDKGTQAKDKVRVLEADVVRYACETLVRLGSGYW